ncbi:hypothetical protein H4S07_002864, partial [Coemansia furcata]
MTKSDARKKRKSMCNSASSLPSTSEPSSSAPASLKPRCKLQRAHSPVSLPEQSPPPVSSTEPALMDADSPDEQPPPPTPTTELPFMDVDPPDNQPAYTEEEVKAAIVLLRAEVAANTHVPIPASSSHAEVGAYIDAAADALAARRQQGDEDYAQIVAGRAAACKAATFDVAEIYREDRRTVVSNARIEEALIAYETAIRAAKADAAALQAAYDDAANAVRVAHSIAMDVIDAEDRIIAATRAAMCDPNHVHIGGDPGV